MIIILRSGDGADLRRQIRLSDDRIHPLATEEAVRLWQMICDAKDRFAEAARQRNLAGPTGRLP